MAASSVPSYRRGGELRAPGVRIKRQGGTGRDGAGSGKGVMAVLCFDHTTSLIPIPLLLPPPPASCLLLTPFLLIHFTPPRPSTFLFFQLIATRLLLPFLLLLFLFSFPTSFFSFSYFFTCPARRQDELFKCFLSHLVDE